MLVDLPLLPHQFSSSSSLHPLLFMADHKESRSPAVEGKDVKSPSILERAKEEIGAAFHGNNSPRRHDKETHGASDDIDEDTPVDEVKGPSVFQRVKEEIEAVAQAVHPKKDH